MLSAVRHGALKACSVAAPARSGAPRRVVAMSKPARSSILNRSSPLSFGLQSRQFASQSHDEGEVDREETAFTYFYRKIRLGDDEEPSKEKSKSKSTPRAKTPSTKPSTQKEEAPLKLPMEKKEVKVTSEDAGSRMDRFVSRLYPKLPNARIQKLLRDKKITVRHPGSETFSKVEGNERLQLGSVLRLRGTIDSFDGVARPNSHDPLEKPEIKLPKEKIEEVRSWVIHKDEQILVVNKPANLAVQGGTGIKESMDELCAALKYEKSVMPKLVHRLDRGASGLLVLARDRPTAQALTKKFERHDISKLYWAVCIGVPKRLAGSVKVGLRKEIMSGEDSERVVVVDLDEAAQSGSDKSVKPSHSRYNTIAHTHKSMSLLALRPRTGRTHQLRVHCADVLKSPIFGDYKYGSGVPDHLQELLGSDAPKHGVPLHLHAREIAFKHPSSDKLVHFTAPLPKHFKDTMAHFDYQLLTDSSPHATLTPEERELKPYEFTFKEGKLKQKLRVNKLSKTDEYKKTKRREHAVKEKLQTASKGSRARLQNLKKSGELTLKSFRTPRKQSSTRKGSQRAGKR